MILHFQKDSGYIYALYFGFGFMHSVINIKYCFVVVCHSSFQFPVSGKMLCRFFLCLLGGYFINTNGSKRFYAFQVPGHLLSSHSILFYLSLSDRRAKSIRPPTDERRPLLFLCNFYFLYNYNCTCSNNTNNTDTTTETITGT